MRFFSRFRKPRLVGFGHWSGRAETVAIEHDAIGAVSQAIECRGAEDAVAGERIAPFAEVEIARQDRRGTLVPFRDQVMEVFVLR